MKKSHKPQHAKQTSPKGLARNLATTLSWLILQTALLTSSPALATIGQQTLTYSQLLKKIDAGEVTKVEIDPTQQAARVTLKAKNKPPTQAVVSLFAQNPELIEKLRAKKIETAVQPTADRSAALGFAL